MNDTTTKRLLPARGNISPRFGHLGVWNYCLGPNSPIPGERLQVFIIDQAGNIVRRFEQIEGRCIDPGYVDFFMSHNCRPAIHERPIVDIDENGKIATVLHPNYTQSLGMAVYLQLLTDWAKSLTAKATASILGRPLLKLDAGRLFGGLVGQSESNLRAALNTAEAIAPCVLWIDEIEKGFSGSKSSGSTDGGTSARVFGGFISWMQERTKPVFVVATANDVTALPPEFLRKGRWDDLFFVDLPNLVEREAIWKIQVLRHGRDWSRYDTLALAKVSEGYTGAEIEQVYVDALYAAFAAGREPGMPDVLKAVADTVPLSKLMGEQIAGLRKWAVGRCRMATASAEESKGRKIAA